MAGFFRLVLLAVFSCAFSLAHAGFAPATERYYMNAAPACPASGIAYFSTPQEACEGFTVNAGACGEDYSRYVPTYQADSKRCIVSGFWEGSRTFDIYLDGGQFCPVNSSLVDGLCECASGFKQSGSSCVVDNSEDDLADYCSQFSGARREAVVHQRATGEQSPNTAFTSTCRVPEAYSPDGGDSGIPMFPGTDKGCGASFEYSWAGTNGSGDWYVHGYETYTGGTCTPGAPGAETPGTGGEGEGDGSASKDPDKSCDGQPGTVNGVTTCVPYAEKTGASSAVTKTNSDGTSEEVKTETHCTETKCTTTTTTTQKDANGQSTGVSVTVKEGAKSSFCAENSGAAICKGGGSGLDGDGEPKFSGGCSVGFTCSGDVLQCVIAKEQHKRNCQLFDDETPEGLLYADSKGKEGDRTTDLPGNRILDMGAPGMFKTDAIFGTGSCIQDISVQVMQRTVQLPFSYICPWVAELRYVLLGLGGLYWMMIVFGRR